MPLPAAEGEYTSSTLVDDGSPVTSFVVRITAPKARRAA